MKTLVRHTGNPVGRPPFRLTDYQINNTDWSITNGELAKHLNVSIMTVIKLRKALGVEPLMRGRRWPK